MDKFKNGLKWFFASFIWLAVLMLAIDIITKNVVINNSAAILSAGGRHGGVDLIPGFLGINYTINQNIAFGMSLSSPLANRIVFSIFALLVSTGIIIFLVLKWGKINKYYRACFMLILAGAIGNVIDRLFYSPEYLNFVRGGELISGVVDWIDFYGIWEFNFNIADSCIVVAAFMLIIYMIIEEIIEYRQKAKLIEQKPEDNEKVLSQTEQEKQRLLEEGKEDDNE